MPSLGEVLNAPGGPFSFAVGTGGVTKGHGVKLSANANEVIAASSQGEAIYGIALATRAAGQNVAVLRLGRVICIAGAALTTLYVDLTIGADARMEASLTSDVILGINLTTAAANGDEVLVELTVAKNVT